MESLNAIKKEILKLSKEYSKHAHSAFRPNGDPLRSKWQIGSPIPYAGRVFTEEEVAAAVSSTLDFWLTLGPRVEIFFPAAIDFWSLPRASVFLGYRLGASWGSLDTRKTMLGRKE